MSAAARRARLLRTPPVAVAAAVLGLLALVDAVLVELRWPVLVFLAVAGLAACALLRTDDRRSRAAAVAAVAASLAGTAATAALALGTWFGFVETAALLLLLISRWRRASTRRDRVLTAAIAAALLVLPLRLGLLTAVPYLVLMVAVVAVTVAVAVALRGQDDARRLAVSAVRRAEREEIARELHDVVAHHVTGIVVATQAARTVAGTDPRAASAALASIEAAGVEALSSMRRLVGVLRSEAAEPEGGGPRLPTPGLADLPALVQRFRDTGAVGAVELSLPDGGPDGASGGGAVLPQEVQSGAYRVVQESLTNVRRHAPGAATVRVALTRSDAAVTVEVVDSGGDPPRDAAAQGGGFGVVGMRERVEALGGALTAGPQARGGWAVRARVPLPDAAGEGRRSG
ncbi:MAG: Two-component system sensor histidine kinase [uncultured Quadrisphaera sp.]|uniref:histidine kinase n=1 Tax=uncultured Quadrisphaera sp. TaxID=904978 RepID=A0A6J4PT92_9ACTN|nr:MAG: Two-component system sensor histidine kinase [uncultured Quadrisphaera sp.]